MGKKKKQKKKSSKAIKEQLLKEERIQIEKKKKKKELVLTAIFSVFAIVIAVVVLWRVSGEADNPAKKIVFKVGEQPVYLNEVNLCILQNVVNLGITKDMLDSTTAEDGSDADSFYKNEILETIMNYKVGALVAEQRGITLSEKEEATVKSDAVEYMAKIDARILRMFGITQELVTEVYRQRYLAHILEEDAVKDIEVKDQNFCTMYMLLFPKVLVDEEGMYVTKEDGVTPILLSEDEIVQMKENADSAYEELMDGAEIEDVAEKYGISKVSGEESNIAESFGEPFAKYAAELKTGEYSPVLETESCYAILKMVRENNEELAKQVLEYYKSDVEKDTVEEERAKWYEEAGISREPEFVGTSWKNVTLYDFVQYVEE